MLSQQMCWWLVGNGVCVCGGGGRGGRGGGCMILGRGRARTCTYLAIRLHINRSPCKCAEEGGGMEQLNSYVEVHLY